MEFQNKQTKKEKLSTCLFFPPEILDLITIKPGNEYYIYFMFREADFIWF